MAMTLEEALQKVTALEGVRASFVFDQFHTIVARDVPGQYSNDILKRIASQLHQISTFSLRAKVATLEFRLVYDQFAVYVRLFAKNFYLVVFMDKTLEPGEFRQPLNLAVLVLDRAIRNEDVFASSRALAQVAHLAETSIRETYEVDPSFAGQFRKLCVIYLGQTGRDTVDLAIEELRLAPPVRKEAEMRQLRDFVLSHVVHPIKRRILEQEGENLMRKALAHTS